MNWIIPWLMFYLVKDSIRRFRITVVWAVISLGTCVYSKTFLQDFSTLNIFFPDKGIHSRPYSLFLRFLTLLHWKLQSERVNDQILCSFYACTYYTRNKRTPLTARTTNQTDPSWMFSDSAPRKATGLEAGRWGKNEGWRDSWLPIISFYIFSKNVRFIILSLLDFIHEYLHLFIHEYLILDIFKHSVARKYFENLVLFV